MTTKYQLNSTPSQWVNGGFEFTAYQLTSQETELVASSTPSSADYQLRCEIVADALLSALLPKYNSSYDRQTIAVYVRLRDSIREARIPVDHAAWQTLEPRLRTTLMAFLRVYSPSTSSGRDPFLAQDSLLHPDTVSTIRIACEQFRGLAGLPQVTASAAPPISGPTPAAKSGATSRGNRDRKP